MEASPRGQIVTDCRRISREAVTGGLTGRVVISTVGRPCIGRLSARQGSRISLVVQRIFEDARLGAWGGRPGRADQIVFS